MSFIDSINKFFKKDKSIQADNIARGISIDDPALLNSPMRHSDNAARLIMALMSVDQDLMYRYSDYEEMDDYPELSCALNIYADDSTISDNIRGKTVWAESKDNVVRDLIDDLLHRRLRIEEDVWGMVRELCKYGNLFAELIITQNGVMGLNMLPTPTMRRIVSPKGQLLGFVQDLSGTFNIGNVDLLETAKLKAAFSAHGMVFFEPWEVVHWRLKSKFVNSIYGIGVEDAARWVWKRLVMLEDTVLAYRLTRGPGHYAFYIDTGDLPPKEAKALVDNARRQYKKQTLINPRTGKLEFRNNPLSPADDFWIPTRGGKESSRIDVVSGPDWQALEDIEHLRDKLFTCLMIPRSYYGGDADASQGLAHRDVRFARTCMRIQREFRNGIRQIIRVHMAALGIDPDNVKWETRMTAPSSIFELQQIETMNARAGLIDTLSNDLPREWLFQRVFQMSKDEVDYLINSKRDEKEGDADNDARIANEIQKKYPGLDMDAIGESLVRKKDDMNKISRKVDKITEALEKNIQSNNVVLQKIEGIKPMMGRMSKRLKREMISNREVSSNRSERANVLFDGNFSREGKDRELRRATE